MTKLGALNIPGTYTHCHKSTQLLVAGLPQTQFTTVFMKVICKPTGMFEFQHLNRVSNPNREYGSPVQLLVELT